MDNEIKQFTVSDYSSMQRKNWVLDQYLAGRLPALIREEYKELYKLSDASYDKDVTWTNTELRKQGENQKEVIIDRHTDRYNYIYKLAIEKGDLRSANQALKGIEDLYQLHRPASVFDASNRSGTLVQVNNQNINLPHMTLDEIRELLGKSNPTSGRVITIEPVDETE